MAGIQQLGPSQTHGYLVNKIQEKLLSLGPPLSPECCIYRVPKKLRNVNGSAYTPQIVSIGPLHHGKKYLQKMENLKHRYLKNLLPDPATELHNWVNYIKEKETRIRQCYAESFDYFSSDEFVEMVLVDAAFIIELFLRVVLGTPMADHELAKAWLQFDIEQDLILLENQIPFFILKDLYDLVSKTRPSLDSHPFSKLTLDYFKAYNSQEKPFPRDIKHFTDLLWHFLLPSSPAQASPSQSCCPDCCKHLSKFHSSRKKPEAGNSYLTAKHIYNATKLYEGGVKFKTRSSNCMLDINFNNGYLEMPCFKLYHTTESYIRNIMALELCHYPYNTPLCDYILLMDYLINTAKDVELLVQEKVMENWLGDHHAAATFFNKLRFQNPDMENIKYSETFDKLNAYCAVPCHGWRATLLHEYFKSPWRGASTAAAVILLVLTATQTVFSGISL